MPQRRSRIVGTLRINSKGKSLRRETPWEIADRGANRPPIAKTGGGSRTSGSIFFIFAG